MPTLTQHTPSYKQTINNLLHAYTWEECNHDIKAIYTQVKNRLTEEEQSDLLIDIYNNTVCDYCLTEYWRYMNSR